MALVFKVRRKEQELVKPAKPTPIEMKSLSDWDNGIMWRTWTSCIMFYDSGTTPRGNDDPAETLKKALAEALVDYYPLAGRFKEQGPGKRLVVDCTAEGVGFVSAEADVRLDQFGLIRQPFPCMSELLYNKPSDPSTTLGCPIFVMQITRLACGGFIIAFSFNHVMSDMVGIVQFVTAISELACGAQSPSLLPVWQRELLNVRDNKPPPNVPNKSVGGTQSGMCPGTGRHMTYRSFFFGEKELEAIRARLPRCSRDCFTSFELISGCVFNCRAISVEHAPEEQVFAVFLVNARSRFIDPPLPSGYYGNASLLATITCPVRSFHDLCYVVEEVKKANRAVTEDYVRSAIEKEKMAPRSSVSPPMTCQTYGIADVSRSGLSYLDFGWGKPVYAGTIDDGNIAHVVSFIDAAIDDQGKEGRLITLYLPKDSMDKFDLTLRTLLGSI